MRSIALPRRFPCTLSGALPLVLAAALLAPASAFAQAAPVCERTVVANVVALDQVFFWNRLGAVQPQGMIFALRRDVVDMATGQPGESPDGTINGLTPGGVVLRDGKRPRPITLRMNVGDCLKINFENLLDPIRRDPQQPATRNASVHVIGMQLVNSIADDGSYVGANPSGPSGMGSLVPPGGTATYTLYADREGEHLLYSAGAQTGGEGDGGSIPPGLFGAVNVEPPTAEWYRSQVTRADMDLATAKDAYGAPMTTPDGHPIIDYDAVYPAGHEFEGLPILAMARNTATGAPCKATDSECELVHSDLTAIITGPGRDYFAGAHTKEACEASGFYPVNTILGNRCEPFREFTIIFHDEIGAVQAFDEFEDPVLSHTLHCCREGFAINYGTGGIGAEILANRFGVGPMWNCNECKYEEFFLSAWAVGDPAMVVDIPANADLDMDGKPDPGPKATKALYPDDPSNVYHSYIKDHVKFRNLHAGPKEHHIFHLHAHQWVTTPDADESTYLDSQAIGPGSEYTYETTYDGSGNRPLTPGDAIFHCHFYPHFAQGMWALWRNHDTFEPGTPLDADGRPVAGPVHLTRALPDGEIVGGTPNPAVVPLPGKPMAPMPTAEFPGYPFYIPGVAGHRAPRPPLDVARDDNTGELLNGGLPRHVVKDDGVALVDDDGVDLSDAHPVRVAVGTPGSGGATAFPPLNRLDFSKENVTLNAQELPEDGTWLEKNAMAFHATRLHPTYTEPKTLAEAPAPANFIANGLPPAPGAPYADPCVDDAGNAVGIPLRWKAVSLQIHATYTKTGWHFPQHRMLAPQEDALALIAGTKAPEPFFFRGNTNHCITYWLTNMVPHVYEMDDFQVRTPTDVLGQHIHLVKFDVTSSDGSGNGYNYEDGSYAADEVRERIAAIRAFNGCTDTDPRNGSFECPEPKPNPYFGSGEYGEYMGLVTTVQRWFADDVKDQAGKDRTLRTVYTHDHFSPSTQQQTGYYAGLVIEPEGSVWRDPETGAIMGPPEAAGAVTRDDGGPTSWRADILTPDPAESYREFNLEYQDFALAYRAGSDNSMKPFDAGNGFIAMGIADPANAINPPGKVEVGLPDLLASPFAAGQCPGGNELLGIPGPPPPCPEGVSAEDPGMMTVNYRAEPIALRVRDPNTNSQAAGVAGDLAHVFRSNVTRADPALNVQPTFYPPLTAGVGPGDPFTPLLRTYADDNVQIRILVGAHEEGHNFSVHGVKWLFEPSWSNSGWRNSQMMGISEHFEFVIPPFKRNRMLTSDYLYMPGSSVDDLWNGIWGIMRSYRYLRSDLLPLPSNPDGRATEPRNRRALRGSCPYFAPRRMFYVSAVTAAQALPGGTLVYNSRGTNGGPLHDPSAILYVRTSDLDASGKLKPGVPIEPLVLRANAGDCIYVRLENRLPSTPLPNPAGFSTQPMIVDNFNNNDVAPSNEVGLHPQLVFYDMSTSDGTNVGYNPVQTVPPGGIRTYQWYAGDLDVTDAGTLIDTPIEFGATALMPADKIKQTEKGAVGALIIEPKGSMWVEDADTRAAAYVYDKYGNKLFREFVVLIQDNLNLRCTGCGSDPLDPDAVPNLADSEDPEDSGQRALNYRTEPMWHRMGFAPDLPLVGGHGGTATTGDENFTEALSNGIVGGDPETPVFTAKKGEPVWFRVVHAGGHQRNHVFTIHGHTWQQLPFINNSTALGDNPLSEHKGSQAGIGPSEHFNFLLKYAGGKFTVTGDYLFRDFSSFQFDGGLWGILRVIP